MSLQPTMAARSASPDEAPPRRSLASLLSGAQGPLIGLVLLCVVFALTTNVFLTVRNALNVVDQVTTLGILALGMTGVIIIGGIDLSVGSILALSIMVLGWLPQDYGIPFPAGVHRHVDDDVGSAGSGQHHHRRTAGGGLPGLVHGAGDRASSRRPVGHRGHLRGPRPRGLGVSPVPRHRTQLVRDRRQRRGGASGRHPGAQADGRGLRRLRVAGRRCRRLDSSQPSAGFGYELDAIAAVVIGGASLAGGIGSVGGTVAGVFIIGVLHNGLNLVGISPFIQQVVIGVVIAVAVTFDTLRRKA